MSRALDAIFQPRSVAVVGASRRRDSIGFALLHNLVVSEFNGAIYPVNPHAAAIHSLKCYPSLAAIPDPIDLAVVMVPRREVQGVVEQAIAKGVRGLVVITAGFAETGGEGAERELQLRETVRAAGVRMIGPNCMGVINTAPEVNLNATFAPTPARAGALGFVSQSGALGVAILNVAQDLGIGLTQFVSMGNKADVSGNDLIEHWEDDPATKVIAMYLESFGNPRRFTEIAKRVTRKKPILVVKSGRTAEGARAAASHTGALASTDLTASAFLEQCGVLRANTIEELFDIGRALASSPLPAGDRVGIVTNAGGPAIMATDACVSLGLRMAELAPATAAALREFLPAEASVANPVDMIASATAGSYARTLAAVLDDPGVDMAMVINVTPLLASPIDVVEAITEVTRGRAKPSLAVMMATDEFYEAVKVRHDLPPVYRFPESAARALSMLARYAAWRRRPAAERAPEFPAEDGAVAAILDRAAAAAGPRAAPGPPISGYLDQADAFRVLELYGIPVARWRVAPDAASALAAAPEIGYPVVAKALAAGLVHKSDVGAVRLDLRGEAELVEALAAMERAVGAAGCRLDGFLVQEMARGGHEVVFGIATEPRFGPLLMFGLGGRYVEVFQDVRFGVPPLDPHEALDMVRGIHGARLLTGVRGEPAADFDLLVEVLLRLAQLAVRHPRIVELDINPFLAAPDRAGAKALDGRIRVAAAEPS
ncbi:MAG TPA: acetate--CoA ligase family protein [Thermoanaerobaculia bacterium]|nr:acetate--CoA ligase family protein [Thermoanaerobaculia bacterium]